MKLTRYALYDSDDILIRIFNSKEEVMKMQTSGDKVVQLPTVTLPKINKYELAVKAVGFSAF